MKTITSILLTLFTLLSLTRLSAQDVYYGDNYVVFEAEATSSSLAQWTLRQKGDADYQRYVSTSTGVDPIFDTYLEYTGVWQGGADTELDYTFTCPKTGDYRLLMRMHQPLRDGEKGDARNDVFVKMSGNFTSATKGKTTEQLKASHKFWGRGVNKWGSAHKLEISNHVEAVYSFTKGEEYTLTMGGRSTGTCIDYILFYEYSSQAEIPQGDDVATFFPAEYRPGLNLVDPSSVALAADTFKLRVGTDYPLALTWNPVNSKQDVTWSTSDDAVFTVDQNGVLSARGVAGQHAMLSVQSVVNDVADSSVVTIVDWYAVALTGIQIGPDAPVIGAGQTLQLSTTLTPSYADERALIWTSSDTAIAVVDTTGLVKAKAEGKVTIRAAAANNAAVYDEVEVITAEIISASLAYDDEAKYETTAYEVGSTLPVTIDYHAGTFNTVVEVKVFLRYMKTWSKVVSDVLPSIPAGIVGSESGTMAVDIDLTGVIPTADLASDEFYFLFVKIKYSDGTEMDKGITPINIVAAASAIAEDKASSRCLIYPNPATDCISLDVDVSTNVTIYNTAGQQVLHKDVLAQEAISLSGLNAGTYFVKVEGVEPVEKLMLR